MHRLIQKYFPDSLLCLAATVTLLMIVAWPLGAFAQDIGAAGNSLGFDMAPETSRFLVNWYERNVELIDKYQPDLIYFDNGIDQHYLDPLKLQLAAYYYNRAKSWGKQVSLTTKKAAYAPTGTNTETIGSITDFEGFSPKEIRTGSWQEDRPIGSNWSYVEGIKISSTDTVLSWLLDAVSKNGTLLLNVSPMADGTIPEDQQRTLLGLGRWLETNGEDIYDTHAWIKPSETEKQTVYFTVKENVLYATVQGKITESSVLITSLAQATLPSGKVGSVTMLGMDKPLTFRQTPAGLAVDLPSAAPLDNAYTLRITGLRMNPPTWTRSGNPIR